MADFQSSKTAQEIETVLTGAVLFNTNTKLTETQKAQARANIGATANGEGIKIISHFDTLAELEEAVKSPNAGDAYSVGANLPYSLYIYDILNKEWRDYGVIRSEDITARFAQNITVGVGAWEEDTNVFVDYTYKAQIPLGEVTGNDFPIVAFAPSDAVGGNFCPVCYAFDGYVEIWAKTIPTTAISIPAITFIVQSGGANGTNTKGITNAGGGIATGGIGHEQIANYAIRGNHIANGAVNRAKLANDALYSPTVNTNTRDITVSDLGALIYNTYNNAATYTLTQANSTNIPRYGEIAFARWGVSNIDVLIVADGVRFGITGNDTLLKNAKLRISDPFGMVALKKMSPDSASGDAWLVTGNVEVVT